MSNTLVTVLRQAAAGRLVTVLQQAAAGRLVTVLQQATAGRLVTVLKQATATQVACSASAMDEDWQPARRGAAAYGRPAVLLSVGSTREGGGGGRHRRKGEALSDVAELERQIAGLEERLAAARRRETGVRIGKVCERLVAMAKVEPARVEDALRQALEPLGSGEEEKDWDEKLPQVFVGRLEKLVLG